MVPWHFHEWKCSQVLPTASWGALRDSQREEPSVGSSPLKSLMSILVSCPQPSLTPWLYSLSDDWNLREIPPVSAQLLQDSYLKMEFVLRIETSRPHPISHLLLSAQPALPRGAAGWGLSVGRWRPLAPGHGISRRAAHGCWKAHALMSYSLPFCCCPSQPVIFNFAFCECQFVITNCKHCHLRSLSLTINLEIINRLNTILKAIC